MKLRLDAELELLKELNDTVSKIDIYNCVEFRFKVAQLIKSLNNSILRKSKTLKDDIGNLSDGYHTFNELYHHRAVLFSVICNQHPELAWKSLEHDDPNQPMYDGMFIVGIDTPEGQATYHYDIDPYWELFNVKELSRAPKWDGHTPEEAIRRIASLSNMSK